MIYRTGPIIDHRPTLLVTGIQPDLVLLITILGVWPKLPLFARMNKSFNKKAMGQFLSDDHAQMRNIFSEACLSELAKEHQACCITLHFQIPTE